jgi:hypothetical protein
MGVVAEGIGAAGRTIVGTGAAAVAAEGLEEDKSGL